MIKKFWRDPVWSAVIAAAIIGGLSYFSGIWPDIWNLIKSIPTFLAKELPIPIWVLLIVVPVLLFLIPFIHSLQSNREPGFVLYTSDIIFDINWSWRWIPPNIYSSNYTLKDLTPRCPSCHAVLKISDYGGSLASCVNENCNWQWERQRQHGSSIGHSSELDSKVRNEIDRRIHAGERG
jgi:hypothetical protein